MLLFTNSRQRHLLLLLVMQAVVLRLPHCNGQLQQLHQPSLLLLVMLRRRPWNHHLLLLLLHTWREQLLLLLQLPLQHRCLWLLLRHHNLLPLRRQYRPQLLRLLQEHYLPWHHPLLVRTVLHWCWLRLASRHPLHPQLLLVLLLLLPPQLLLPHLLLLLQPLL